MKIALPIQPSVSCRNGFIGHRSLRSQGECPAVTLPVVVNIPERFFKDTQIVFIWKEMNTITVFR